MEKQYERPFQILHWTYGAIPIVAGLDKFTGILADWEGYLSPQAVDVLPMRPATFMKMVGLIEIGAGIAVLARPRIGAWITSSWLLGIAANLVAARRYDIAVRDVAMAVGAGVMGQLAAAREQTERLPSRPPAFRGRLETRIQAPAGTPREGYAYREREAGL